MYFVFVVKTRTKSVSRGNIKITWKEMFKLFSGDYSIICRNAARWDAREERKQEKEEGF